MNVADIVSRRIADRRKDLGHSQAALARAMLLVTPTVNRIENHAPEISVERLCQFALALGVEPADLLPRLADLHELTGLTCIETLTTVNRPTGDAYVDAVVSGARRYIAENGHRPRTNGGDASAFVGFDTTWTAINSALERGSNGAPPLGGLHAALDKYGLPGRGRR